MSLQGIYGLQLCNYSFELLMSFLQGEPKYMNLFRTINQFMKITTIQGKPRRCNPVGGLLGLPDNAADSINKKSVSWGALPAYELPDEEDKTVADGDLTEADRERRALKKKKMAAQNPDAPERGRIPLPEIKGRDAEFRLRALEEIQKQAALGKLRCIQYIYVKI